MKLTVMNFKGKYNVEIGDTLTLKKDASDDKGRIDVFKGEEVIGFCIEDEEKLIMNTMSKIAIDTMIDKQGILTSTAKDFGTITLSNGRQLEALVIELETTNSAKLKAVKNNAKKEDYVLEIAGNGRLFPNKIKAINSIKNNETITGILKLGNLKAKKTGEEGEEVILFYTKIEGEEVEVGFVAENINKSNCSSQKEISKLKLFLKDKNDEGIEAVSTGACTSTSFLVEAKVSKKDKEAINKVSINSIIEKGLDEDYKNTVIKIISYLQKNNFTTEEIEDIIKSHNKDYSDEIKAKIPREPKVKYIEDSNVNALKIAYISSMQGYHMLARGPKGSGKNEFTKTLAWVLQKPLYDLTFNRDIDKMDLQGGNTLDSVEENGVVKNSIKFSPEILLEAMENGGIFVADEINFAEPSVLGLLNPVTDTRCSIQVPGYKKVVGKKGFCLIGTMNEGYEGTNELNQSLMDRFVPIVFKAPTEIKNILSQEYPDVSKVEINYANNIYKSILNLVNSEVISSDCITIRGFIQAIPFIKVLGRELAYTTCVANKITDSIYRESVIECIRERLLK